ncbi:beta-glycosidase [Leptospira wolffii]|uniref:Beta-glycosidase n=1 Tax=Leptospira wolffii TaxID=409998 RepID=A0A2M9ZEG3_9LEPT|nr:beta-glycosidase [Leptospira wolffii]
MNISFRYLNLRSRFFRFLFLALLSPFFLFGNCGGGGGKGPLLFFSSPSGINGIYVKDSRGGSYPSGSTLSLGSTLANSSASPITLTLENPSASTVNLTGSPNVSKSGVYSNQYSVTTAASSSINSGDTTTFQLTFSPTSEGVKSAYLLIPSDDPNVGTYILYLTGTGTNTPAPSIEVSDGNLRLASGNSYANFYALSSGSASRNFTIKNSGLLNLIVTNIAVVSGNSVFNTNGPTFTLSPGQSKTFSISFTPGGIGLTVGSLQIQSNDPNQGTFTLGLSGTGTSGPVPQISVTYTDENGINRDISTSSGFSYSFGSVFPSVTSASKSITIRNLGTANLDLSGSPVSVNGTNFNEFIWSQPGLTSLAPNASTTFTVQFIPLNVGSKTATLTLSTTTGDAGSSSSSTLTLTGTGGQRDIIATWAQAKEKAVHMASGGYRVCYKKGATFSTEGGADTCSDVLYSSGPFTPNFKILTVQSPGTWFVRVKSFSTYNSTGSDFSPVMSAVVNTPGY